MIHAHSTDESSPTVLIIFLQSTSGIPPQCKSDFIQAVYGIVGLFVHEIAFVVFLKAFLTPMASENFSTSRPK